MYDTTFLAKQDVTIKGMHDLRNKDKVSAVIKDI